MLSFPPIHVQQPQKPFDDVHLQPIDGTHGQNKTEKRRKQLPKHHHNPKQEITSYTSYLNKSSVNINIHTANNNHITLVKRKNNRIWWYSCNSTHSSALCNQQLQHYISKNYIYIHCYTMLQLCWMVCSILWLFHHILGHVQFERIIRFPRYSLFDLLFLYFFMYFFMLHQKQL